MNVSKNAFEFYKMYIAIKQHFSPGTYDFFKYNGRVSVKESTFLHRRDRMMFERLARKVPEPTWLPFLVANLSDNPSRWVGEMLGGDSMERYHFFASRCQSSKYLFEQDCNAICQQICKTAGSFDAFLSPKKNQYPDILVMYMEGNISLETLWLLDKLLNLQESYDRHLSGNLIWEDLKHKLKRTGAFFERFLDTGNHKYNQYRQCLIERIERNGLRPKDSASSGNP